MTILEWLVRQYPSAKRQTLRRMVQDGRVSVNGQTARRVGQELGDQDRVEVASHRAESAAPATTTIGPLNIVHEDEDVLVIIKPAGFLTSTVPREPRPTVIALIRRHLTARQPAARVGVIHRLDRDASGLLVFSKNHEAFENLKRQFFEHSVQREYTAIVHGIPREASGRIESHLVELTDGSVRATHIAGKGERAVSDYKIIRRLGARHAVLRVTLQTGRKHQIRTQLAQLGHPVLNDTVYGPDAKPTGRLMLAATKLAFTHPRTGERLRFEIPPPPEMRAMMEGDSHKGGRADATGVAD